eukprot:CAMPEP_0180439912 /NCGR_PEP_ID=MMETSP1036_2-20121128/12835_1 /TAXON_ID=632150 /ORGANISM="Azadinium spinosum, Strain 3D9" /LENGTH=68 /DNA_ID=CAMNT_0022446071 /DNA_START=171 /DNA_END=377 /DNA_ORIENTATION=-
MKVIPPWPNLVAGSQDSVIPRALSCDVTGIFAMSALTLGRICMPMYTSGQKQTAQVATMGTIAMGLLQ